MTQWQPNGDPGRQQQPGPWDASGQPPYPPQQPGWQQPGWQPGPQGYMPPPQYGPPPRRRGPLKGIGIGCLGLVALVIIIGVVAGSHSSSSHAPSVAALPTIPTVPVQTAAAAKPAAAATLTYDVTGSTANVTYGPTGTNVQGAVPLHVSGALGSPLYYSIEAQLQGGGTVTCKLEINGKVISQSTAVGGYNIAMCEISKDPLTGSWSDTNGS